MPSVNPRLEQLQETIELNYHCRAKHIGSPGVVETSGGESSATDPVNTTVP